MSTSDCYDVSAKSRFMNKSTMAYIMPNHPVRRKRVRTSGVPATMDRHNGSLVLVLALLLVSFFIPSKAFHIQYYARDTTTLSPYGAQRTSLLYGRHSVRLFGKGDGKKKRKKQSTTTSAPAADTSTSSTAPPRRVSNHINIPVRHQIRMAQLWKDQSVGSSSFRQRSVERTKYRRTWDEDELVIKAEERRRRGQDIDWDLVLSRNATSPLVIVDGYNIIHKWSRLKKHMIRGDPARARQLLVDDLENLRSLKGWRIEVVFDGTGRSTVGPLGDSLANKPTRLDQEARASVSKYGVRVVFTGVGVEADSYIESRCSAAKDVTQGVTTSSFIVATDDSMIRMAGQNAGALCMSADRFVHELKAVKKTVEYRVEAAVAAVNGHAVRPEKLRNSQNLQFRFGRNSVLIEDKRNRTKVSKEKDVLFDVDIHLEEDEDGIPWWAKVPNMTGGRFHSSL